ncbi:hypothetical protein XBJ2_2580034 [Xenorhabdus bovienii str. Jollieti]|uniref:Uncharacterized protein n=1 Tax=Xenorhabdus bovienii (strain SS-2004) TaxID=406818 RepID=D3UXI9_XENBS|nr:hypothetical protein [Xenorhabdus bovienii]CBJ80364.1 hypothetical protein XBJ1_1231 [Xenorhabdus bovienii SS-2004]CDH29387.1 hypothetical protein XBJ2_2580034 [Xenorhabdus bovienii str. Jollieti]
MNNERIAFIHPYNPDSDEQPLLVFECEELPFIVDFHFKVFMINLKHDEPYYIQSQLFRVTDSNQTEVCDKKGFWMKTEDTQGKPDDIAASIRLSFLKSMFSYEGTYFVRTGILVNNEEIDGNEAYFKVSLVNE